jgi:ABC-type Zn uptake system ZnuABC Zn-binding protein ZnuA
MKTTIAALTLLSILLLHATPRAKVRIVASSPDLASIAELVGGDKVEVTSISKGTMNPHYVEVLPSYMIKVKRADVYLRVGMDSDIWAQQIIDGSRNGKLLIVDCSRGIAPLNVPTRQVDASMGDIHPSGNPHYWLDPDNGLVIAQNINAALGQVDSENAEHYRKGLEDFGRRLEAPKAGWEEVAAAIAGMEIITYHDTWPYFSQAFGVTVAGWVEPLPGIEPTPSHTAQMVELVKSRDIEIIGVEPYFSLRTPESISRQTGAAVIVLPTSVGGVDEATDYFELFNAILTRLSGAVNN